MFLTKQLKNYCLLEKLSLKNPLVVNCELSTLNTLQLEGLDQ